jgi:hypothetical protein
MAFQEPMVLLTLHYWGFSSITARWTSDPARGPGSSLKLWSHPPAFLSPAPGASPFPPHMAENRDSTGYLWAPSPSPLPPNRSPHWQKQLHGFTVIPQPQDFSSSQSPVLGLIKNGTRNQTAWVQHQVIADRALDITCRRRGSGKWKGGEKLECSVFIYLIMQ